ncbi:MAG: Bax inhibitor-1/YccA family protein [Candidatus Gastranaerophilales bacterium]|nr:Bax inhibitor-1/YccA family protein [Candidatus Gastranaerophilales bacterium]
MSNNPMLKVNVAEDALSNGRTMSVSNTINKTAILLGLVIIVAYFAWNLCAQGFSDKAMLLLAGGSIGGLILAIITAFNHKAAPITAPAYAACEGLVVGAISYAYGSMYDGIVLNALGITIVTLLSMLFMYKNNIIRATEKFKKVIFISTGAIFIFYLVGFIGALMGHPMTIFNGGLLGIGVSLAICVIAALNFIVDFDFIEKGEQYNYPSYYEWYGAFSLLVTLVWLYLEVLRLLAQIMGRRD